MDMSPSTFTVGPRGRRVLLELAMMRDDDLAAAVQQCAFAITRERGDGGWVIAFESGAERSSAEIEQQYAREAPTAADIAAHLDALSLPETGPSPQEFNRALMLSVATARYWQEPDGTDVLAAMRDLRRPLRHLAAWAAPRVPAVWTQPPPARQHAVTWRGEGFTSTGAQEWKTQTLAEEERARRERPADVTENWSGTWWSFPDGTVSSAAVDGVPTVLHWSEDSSGWQSATTAPVQTEGARIFTIENTSAWNTLCWDQPLEVTASRRHDWYRVSGLDTRWVIPDWAQLAKKYDAVHLSVGAYLAGATHALTVDTGINTMIAGWGPGETRWLNAPHLGKPTRWTFNDADLTWRQAL